MEHRGSSNSRFAIAATALYSLWSLYVRRCQIRDSHRVGELCHASDINYWDIRMSKNDHEIENLRELIRSASDLELLGFIAKKGDCWSDEAFVEFVTRHRDYMFSVCSRTAEALKGEAWISDILEDTFAFVYERADGFKVRPGAVNDVDRQRREIRSWMGRIANFKLRRYLRGHHDEATKDSLEWEVLENERSSDQVAPADENRPANPLLDMVGEAIEMLNEREQLVIRTTFQFHRIGKLFQRMPNKDADDLAKQMNTTPENVRKIRQRAMEKIRAYIAENEMAHCQNVRRI